MPSWSNKAEKLILKYIVNAGGAAGTRPTSWKIALFKTVPDEANAGEVEVNTTEWPSYARQNVTFAEPTEGNPTTTSNTNLVDFGTADVPSNVTLAGFGVVDQDGDVIAGPYSFAEPQIVQNGNPVSYAIGALTLSED